MVAKIHQENPDLEVVDLVYKFFETYSQSDWKTPVTIKNQQNQGMSLTKWKSTLDTVERDLMAILSPNYELRNTTQKVQEPTFDTIIAEIKRGWDVMRELTPYSQKCFQSSQNNPQKGLIKYPLKKQDENNKEVDVASWTKFFKRIRFFGKQFKHFIRIDIVANSVDDNNESALEWIGFVESKLFILLNMIAKESEISSIRAYPGSFSNKENFELGLLDQDIARFETLQTYFLGFNLINNNFRNVVNLEDHAIQFCQKLDFGRISKQNTDVRILHFRRDELPPQLVKMY